MISLVFSLILFAAVYFGFLIKVLLGLNNLSSEAEPQNASEVFISVIVPFRNEAHNLAECLKGLTTQNYPREKFELIFVNDGSTDNSLEVIENFGELKNVTVLSIESNGKSGHKKQALEKGIDLAKGDWIVTTDADCIFQNRWLSAMSSYFSEGVGFVSGPVAYKNLKGIFAKLQNLEFSGLVLAGAGLIGARRPVICNGANLAFVKKAFKDVNGYDGNRDLSSGDDEFLMRKIARKGNWKVRFCFNRNAVVETHPVSSVSEFVSQRKRWASKGLFYESTALIVFLISIFLFFSLSITGIIVGAFYNIYLFAITLALIIVKAIFEYAILKRGFELNFPQFDIKWFLFAELLHVPYIIAASLLGAFGNFSWKGRELSR